MLPGAKGARSVSSTLVPAGGVKGPLKLTPGPWGPPADCPALLFPGDPGVVAAGAQGAGFVLALVGCDDGFFLKSEPRFLNAVAALLADEFEDGFVVGVEFVAGHG